MSVVLEKELPRGWVRYKIEQIGEIVTGNTPTKKNKTYFGDEVPFFKPSDLDIGYHVFTSHEKLSYEGAKKARLIPEKSVLVTCIGATIGKTGMNRIVGATNQQINSVISNVDICIPEYLYYFFTSSGAQKSIIANSSSTTLPIINKSKFSKLIIPLPPPNEQKRIVAKIDELFSLIDNINQNIGTIKKQLHLLNESALIHHVPKAFSDFLNKSMFDLSNFEKEKNKFLNKIPEKWEWLDVSQISDIVTDGSHLTPPRLNNGELMLSAKNVRNGYLDLTEISYVSKENFERELNRCRPQKNDILMVSVGATIGRTAIVRNEPPFMLVRSVALIRPSNKIISNYLLYWLQNFFIQKVIKRMIHDTARGGLYLNKIKKIPVIFPSSYNEQKEIIDNIQSFKSYVDYYSKLINDLEQKIITIKNSILKQAFEGKLVPQDPNDEPAEILLQKIKKEKQKTIKETKPRKKKNDK